MLVGSPRRLFFVVVLRIISCVPATTQNLTDAQVSVVGQRLAEGASHSWEYGTRSEVLLEYNASSYSVLSSSAVPPPQQIHPNLASNLNDVFAIAHTIVAKRSVSNGNVTGPQPLVWDSSAGDPASIGVAVLLANWTSQGASDGLDYSSAAQDQLEFLLQSVPKTQDGAVSHRMDQVQLWSDSVYMVPPFLAYYGVISQNVTLLQEAYNQISLYRKYLRDVNAHNLWKHIQLGSYGTDDGHWSTGNAWAAAGIIRVLGTIQNSQYTDSFKQQQDDLSDWIQEIHDGMYRHQDSSGLFHNYASNSSTFLDASSTALLAGTVYRLSLLRGVHTHLSQAERSRRRLSWPGGPSGLLHFTNSGWLMPVVDPYAYPYQGQNSPEGQAFVIAMQAAWRDWVTDGALGSSGSRRTLATSAAAHGSVTPSRSSVEHVFGARGVPRVLVHLTVVNTHHPSPARVGSHQHDRTTASTDAAEIDLRPTWATLLGKALEGKDTKELLSKVGAGGGASVVDVGPAAGGSDSDGAAAAIDEPK